MPHHHSTLALIPARTPLAYTVRKPVRIYKCLWQKRERHRKEKENSLSLSLKIIIFSVFSLLCRRGFWLSLLSLSFRFFSPSVSLRKPSTTHQWKCLLSFLHKHFSPFKREQLKQRRKRECLFNLFCFT